MTGKNLITSHFLKILKKINWNQVLQSNQDNINITFENYLNTMNTLINSHATLKNSIKNKESFNRNHGLLKESKIQLKRKIESLKSTLNIVIVIKIFFIKNIKHRNSLSTLLKQSKKSYHNNYFRNNINNIQKYLEKN